MSYIEDDLGKSPDDWDNEPADDDNEDDEWSYTDFDDEE